VTFCVKLLAVLITIACGKNAYIEKAAKAMFLPLRITLRKQVKATASPVNTGYEIVLKSSVFGWKCPNCEGEELSLPIIRCICIVTVTWNIPLPESRKNIYFQQVCLVSIAYFAMESISNDSMSFSPNFVCLVILSWEGRYVSLLSLPDLPNIPYSIVLLSLTLTK
jgi:hypothetical protein